MTNDEQTIFVVDDLSPESVAMLAALYSRDPKSVVVHLKRVQEVGAEKFMGTYYVGYGHASIGDCGSTSIFVEQISMLAAKAIQDWPLYNGQEASTRYIDFSSQPILDPTNSDAGKKIQENWRQFYSTNLPLVQEDVAKKYPRREGESENAYAKAVKARAFDIMRGFLPAGATTLVAWHTNLRQAGDKLGILRHHPLPEVSDLGKDIFGALHAKYPGSYGTNRYEATENYVASWSKFHTYLDEAHHNPFITPRVSMSHNIDRQDLEPYLDLLSSRPPMTNLPVFLNELGSCKFEFLLDFGSFRDIQRHRNGVCRMPLLTTKYGFHSWYLSQLPNDEMRSAASALLIQQEKDTNKLGLSSELAQYFIPMGYQVFCRLTMGLMPTVYVIDLRSGKTIHPTLRKVIHEFARLMGEQLPEVKLHANMDPDDWDVRRGTHDITLKEAP